MVAPAHNTPYLQAIRQFQELTPQAMLIGAFETAFHTTIPLERKMYGIPYEWYEKYGIERLGYHGASHSYNLSYHLMSRNRGHLHVRMVSLPGC